MCDVNIISGEVYHFSRDFYLPGRVPFLLERNYSSFLRKDGPLGWGWQLSLDVTAHCTPGGTSLIWEDGRQLNLPPIAVGQRIDDQASGLRLRRDRSALTVTTSDLFDLHLTQANESERYLLTRRADQFGNQILLDRDSAGLVRFVMDSCGRSIDFIYDGDGHLTDVWLRAPIRIRLMHFEYSSSGDLVAATNRTGTPFVYSYDNHLLVTFTNRVAGSVCYAYDSDLKCTQTWRSDGWRRSMRRDPEKRKVLLVDSKGNETVLEHNENGHLVRARDASGIVTENVYDATGQLIYSSGSVSESQFFDTNTQTLISVVDGEQTKVQYDEAGFPTSQVDPEGTVADYVYKKGQLCWHKTARGDEWEFDYDERGELRAARMPNGRIIQRSVDDDSRTEAWKDNYGVMEMWTYDHLGRVVQFEGPGGLKTQLRYADRNEMITALLPDHTTVSYEYDPQGNLVRETDALGRRTDYTFTPFGILTSIVRAGGWRLDFEYDTEDNMVTVTSPTGTVARMEYNQRAQMIVLRSFDGRETHFGYDDQNRLTSCLEVPSGIKIDYEYDGQSRMTRASYSDGAFIEADYSAGGDIVALTNESCRLKFELDLDGNVIREETDDAWVQYTYDPLGNIESVSSSWGSSLRYSWDLRGRLATASLSPTQVYGFDYDGRDLLVACFWPNGYVERLVYDPVDRLIETHLHDESGTERYRVNYVYDDADRLVRISRHDGVNLEYTYDVLDRVLRVKRDGIVTESYEYDLDGNTLVLRDGTPVRVEPGGRIVLEGGNRSVSYDDAGRLESQTVDGATFKYRHNALGQLTSVEDQDGNLTRFVYDGLGRRVRKISPSGNLDFLWTSLTPLVERGRTGSVTYLFLPGSFFLKAADNGKPFSFVLDHLGSPIGAFSDPGQPPIQTERSLWAELTPDSLNHDDVPDIGRLGQYWDADLGLYYNWHRYYDPSLARYLEPDPLDLSGGLNLYAYPEQPLAWVDPFGLYICRIKMNECWNEAQEADAAKKLERLNEKKQENPNLRSDGRCTFQTAEERWKYCKKKGRLTKNQLKEKRQFRAPCTVQHIDHILEKQLKGGDDCDNLQALNAKVNMSFGAQILRCRRNNGYRTPSSFQFYKTQTIPCKPGNEC